MFSGWQIRIDDVETCPGTKMLGVLFMHELYICHWNCCYRMLLPYPPPSSSLQPQARGESHGSRRLGLANHTLHIDRHILKFQAALHIAPASWQHLSAIWVVQPHWPTFLFRLFPRRDNVGCELLGKFLIGVASHWSEWTLGCTAPPTCACHTGSYRHIAGTPCSDHLYLATCRKDGQLPGWTIFPRMRQHDNVYSVRSVQVSDLM